VHRIGRTGRAGRSGEAILFVAPREKHLLRAIERATRQEIALLEMPSTEVINDKRIAAFKQRITDTLASEGLEFYQDILEQYRQEHNIPALEIAAALAKIAQGDEPLLLKNPPKEKARPVETERQPRRQRRETRQGAERMPEPGMESFRIEVGHEHGVKPANIVGAIANEAGLDSQYIGHIKIYDDYSTVDLPEGMPKEVFRELQKVWIAGQKMRISRLGEARKEGKKKIRLKTKSTKGEMAKRKSARKKPAKAKTKKKAGKTKQRA
jgi:ATP-dependent RNA helicase DeaD